MFWLFENKYRDLNCQRRSNINDILTYMKIKKLKQNCIKMIQKYYDLGSTNVD